MNIQAEEKVWQRELLKEWKEEWRYENE